MAVKKSLAVGITLSAIAFVWGIDTINGATHGLVMTSWTGFFPDSQEHIRPSFTGISVFDFFIKLNIAFFAPAFDERNRELQIFFMDFMASMEALSMVMSIESIRHGNQKTSVARSIPYTQIETAHSLIYL